MTIKEVGRRHRADIAKNPEGAAILEADIAKLGDEIWRGSPLAIVDEVTLPPHTKVPVTFSITPDNLPPVSLPTFISNVRVHVRSRNAHIGLDVPENFVETLAGDIRSKKLNPERVKLEMLNHGSRAVRLRTGEKPLHFYIVPPSAEIKGSKLNNYIGREIHMMGTEDKDWVRYYGNYGLEGIYLRINKDPDQMYWMPPLLDSQPKPITLADFHSYREVREHLFQEDFTKISDIGKPRGHIWIGQLSDQRIGPGIYAVLSNKVYKRDDDGNFKVIPGEFQTECNLIEGRVNEAGDGSDLSHHVEIVGDSA